MVIDEYSRFPFVEIVNSTSAHAVIPKLDSILTFRGIPEVIKSGNGPLFNGKKLSSVCNVNGFQA